MTTYPVQNLQYRWPVILAAALHLGLLLLLIGSMFFYHPTETATQQRSIQASLVSASELSAMMAASRPTPVQNVSVAKPLPPTPKPIKPVVTPPPPKPVVKSQPTVQTKPVPATPMPTRVSAKNAATQKSFEEALMQEEMQSTSKPTKVVKSAQSVQTQEALMDQQLEAEETGQLQQAAQASARSKATQGEVDKYKALILQQIQQNWIMPKNVQDLSCLLKVQVAPGGMVVNVTVLKSSGNPALDRSAVAAVNKSSPLPVPKDEAAFSAFRTFTLTVKPEGSELTEE